MMTLLPLLLAVNASVNGLHFSTGIDDEAQLPYWQVANRGMSLRLVQRLPDQTRGYFMARGFTAEQAEQIAQSCVFQTVFKNISHQENPSDLRYDLREWAVASGERRQGLKTREAWQPEWQAAGVTRPAQIAFEWSLYPTEQLYRPGDYNWGMSIFNLPPGSRFELTVVWHQYGQEFRVTIPDMQCAPDRHLEPGEVAQ